MGRNTQAEYEIETVEGPRTVEYERGHTDCEGCNREVRIDSEGIAWGRNAFDTYERHTCPGEVV